MNEIVRHTDAGPAWSGMNAHTVIEVIDRAANREPDKPAMLFEEGLVVTRKDLRDRIERFAATSRHASNPATRSR
jgi:acyl-CoA synthetase (AMP-forming)/AMP-acid ligase II